MSVRRLLQFGAAVLMFAGVAHLVVALVLTLALHAMYPRRIYDVRRWSDDAAASFRLVGTWLNENARVTEPVIAFAGSSVTFGLEFREPATFAGLFAERRPEHTVVNASIIAADLSGINDWIVCAARRNGIRFSALIVELPVVNTLGLLVRLRQGGNAVPALSTCSGESPDPGYLRFGLTNVRGTSWFRFLWNPRPVLKANRQISIERVPPGYFAPAADFTGVRESFEAQIVQTLQHAQTAAETVYAFPSPVYIPGLREAGADDQAMAEQLASALSACHAVAGVRCIDSSKLYFERSFYFNLTHLNEAGHVAMAAVLNAHVAVP